MTKKPYVTSFWRIYHGVGYTDFSILKQEGMSSFLKLLRKRRIGYRKVLMRQVVGYTKSGERYESPPMSDEEFKAKIREKISARS